MRAARFSATNNLVVVTLILAFIILAAWVVFPVASAKDDRFETVVNTLNLTDSVLRISLSSNDILYNPGDGQLYASIPASAGTNGNSIVRVNPLTGEKSAPVYIGSEPTSLALSGDSESLYVVLKGAYSYRRYDVATHTPGPQYPLDYDLNYGNYTAPGIAVSPDDANSVVALRKLTGVSSTGGAAVYDNGVVRPQTTRNQGDENDQIVFGANSGVLWGSGRFSNLKKYTRTANGISFTGSYSVFYGSKIRYDDGFVFGSDGKMFDTATESYFGYLVDANSQAFTSDKVINRAYYLVRGTEPGVWNLRVYEVLTGVFIASTPISGVVGDAVGMVRYGSNGLVVRTTGNQLILIQSSLIPTNNPLPTPTGAPIETPTPTPLPVSVFTREMNIATNELLSDEVSERIYAGVSGSQPDGNALVAVNPSTGTIDSSVYVGSEPNKIAMTADRQSVYVGLDGSSAIRKVSLPTMIAGGHFPVGADTFNGPYSISGVAVSPVNENLVAVSRREGGFAIYENGIRRTLVGPSYSQTSSAIAFSESGNELFGLSSSPGFSRMTVGPDGLRVEREYFFKSNWGMTFSDGLFFGTAGEVIDPNNGAIVGTYQFARDSNYRPFVVPDPVNGRVFFLYRVAQNYRITAFDINTYLEIGTIELSRFEGNARGFARWGSNGLAVSLGEKLLLIQSTLVKPGEAVPVPTPTPSVTPTPAETNFLRSVDLRVNDLVINQPTGLIDVSVSGIAAPDRRNTITRLDPTTGAILSSVPVGTEPTTIAASDDHRTLYVKLDGESVIRRFDTVTQTPGAQFTVDNFSYLQDIAVLPGNPQTVAVTQRYNGVAVYDDGIRRPTVATGSAYAINRIETENASEIYGYTNESSISKLVRFAVGPQGTTATGSISGLFGGNRDDIFLRDGRIYSLYGRVSNAPTNELLGTFQASGTAFTIDRVQRRAYFLKDNVLSVFDLDRFVKLGSTIIPPFNGTPMSLVRWGENGLAFRTTSVSSPAQNSVYLLQSSLVNANAPVPTGVAFSASGYYESESFLPTIQINRTGNLSGQTTINYATSDGTAVAGSDYVATSGTLTFEPGETQKSFVIPLIRDRLYEGNENLRITLSEPSAGTSIVNSAAADLTISDSDSRPTISLAQLSTTEPAPNATGTSSVVVLLSNPSVERITVNFQTADGTASAGSDYVPASGTIVIEPTVAGRAAPVTILGDREIEPNESINLSISSATNATIDIASSTIVIRNYNAMRRARFDFDGDNRSDVSIFRPPGGEWWYQNSSTGETSVAIFGGEPDQLTPGDFSGDGKTDVAFWRVSTGEWFVQRSEDGSYFSVPFGMASDVPVPGDYDGDGLWDFAVFRPSTGYWYILNSGGGVSTILFGSDGDRPQIGDFDGDGKSDIAVFRPSDGNWWHLRSSDLQTRVTNFGVAGDRPVPGDFTGDGRADIAVFRPSTGEWFVLRSENDSFYSIPFGLPEDLAVPGDYDGDGRWDAAVFRPSTSTWYLNRSFSGTAIQTYGLIGDRPVPGAFVR